MTENVTDFDGDMPELFLRTLASDYIKWRLSLEDYDFPIELSEPEFLNYSMRDKCSKVEESMTVLIDNMIAEMNISPQTTFPTFMTLVNDKLFNSGVDWTKIYTLFAFSGKLSVHCLKEHIPQLIDNVCDWLAVYIESRLTEWIENNGNWNYVIKE